ncbi:glycine-rich domain-containing protein [Paenibacillus azoreducens]|uniref:Glycine-rich domain-containing protein n=1 Tax=Paenibacillus azoreducens TaxID=116718 RepID=A0A920CRL2_9BACL|nr:hypothetical protein [Paenibacillus azoreducens]GIO47244.1 hypothetical protein J34TS1_20090 [Paenibacillus azoreducens]
MAKGITLQELDSSAIVNLVPYLGTTSNNGDAFSITTNIPIDINQKFTIKFNAASSTAPTLKINDGTSHPIKKANGNNAKLYASVYTLFWDGSAFILQGEGGDQVPPGEKIYNVPGTYTFEVPDGISRINARIWGAGGGGGAGHLTTYNVGGGGGAGAYLMLTLPVVPGQKLAVVVGKGGAGGTFNIDFGGTAGGSSSVGSYTAYGGGPGLHGTAMDSGYGGRGGNLYRTGDSSVPINGAPNIGTIATLKYAPYQISGYTGCDGNSGRNSGDIGQGGGSPGDMGLEVSFGVGGPGIYYKGGDGGGCRSGQPGGNGGVGAGGGGGYYGSTNYNGGKGGDGMVIITW